MRQYFKETYQVIRLNLLPLVAFDILYRLAAGALYVKLMSLLLRISLRSAGYSYLTLGNLAGFLANPLTAGCLLLLLALGMVLMVFEVGGLVSAYQAAAYSRRLSVLSIARGAFFKTADEFRKKNWRLGFLALASYLMMNSYILFRIFTRIKPINFVMDEILNLAAGRLALCGGAVGLVLVGVPSMLVFFTCMVEQKRFRDGLRRSRELVKGRWPWAIAMLVGVNLLLILALAAVHVILLAAAALIVRILVDGYASVAVLAAVGGRIEAAILAVGSMAAAVADFGVLTVAYCQFEKRQAREPAWDFSGLGTGGIGRKRALAVSAAVLALTLFVSVDMVYNGSVLGSDVLTETRITAHRGSSKQAPENTLPAIEAAIDEMADFCEIDVQMTADGQIVVCHDLNLKRLAGVDRRLGDMTFDQVKSLDVGSYMGEAFAGTRIPALEEVLRAAKGRIRLNIELKNIGNDTDLPERTAAMILEWDMQEQCVITSVKLKYLERVKAVSPDIRTGYILPAAYGRYYHSPAFDFISIRSSFVTRSLVERCHEEGKAVHVWTVNQLSEMEQMRLLGVDNIITDYPAKAREVLYQEDGAAGLMEYVRMILK